MIEEECWYWNCDLPATQPCGRCKTCRVAGYRVKEKVSMNDEDEFDLEQEMEDGIVISVSSPLGSQVLLTCQGKRHGTFPDIGLAVKAARQWMQDQSYWPNVFYVNDHGNVDLLSVRAYVKGAVVISVDWKTERSWV